MLRGRMPPVRTIPGAVALLGGMDISSPPLFAKPGSAKLAYNYEPAIGGGFERIGGYERFDGRSRPSDAAYVLMELAAAAANVAIGDTITGDSSAATGVVIYIDGTQVAVTKVVGSFAVAEDVLNGVDVVGNISSLTPEVDGFLDNELSARAADQYRADITKVPGSGRIRGIAVLGSSVYAWRNNALGTAMDIYKATTSGWAAVTLYYELSFTVGATEPAEGATITQGGTSATVKRVVLESGSWGAGTAAGRYIITQPSGGSFSAGALGGSAGTVPGAGAGVYHGSAITLSPSGRVRWVVTNFGGSVTTRRLYGCDGVNREFEFADDILVPIVTGMGSRRATLVKAHKNHLFLGYGSSLQHSVLGYPYQWTAVLGAGELGTGDTMTNLVSVGGSESAAALMVLCENSIFILYGNDVDSWNFSRLSDVSGARADSAHDIGGVIALDKPGFNRYPASQSFGNFAWDSASLSIDALARGQDCYCSVFVAPRMKYRVFFSDGTGVTGMPMGNKRFEWTTFSLGRNIVIAEHAEISGDARTFYGDDDGWVLEADVGRSFDGEPVQYAVRLNELTMGGPMVLKQFRGMQLEAQSGSAMTLSASAEIYGEDEGAGQQTEEITIPQYGAGLIWDLSNYDQSYWDVPGVNRKSFPVEGEGSSIAVTIAGESDNEMPHTLRAVTIPHTPRRLQRTA